MNLVRHSVSRSSDPIDRVFQELTSGWFSGQRTAPASQPPMRIRQIDGAMTLSVDLPGVPREAINVDVTERTLTIAVEHSDEFDTISWNHRVTLGGSLNPDGVEARYVDGRLTVTVPRTPQAPSRRIELG